MNIKLANSELQPTLILMEKTPDVFTPIGMIHSDKISKEVVKRVNMHNEAMDTLLTFVRESKSNTEAVKKAVELLNRNKE
jgi:hypothetical protein